jgi:hypothetical protein
MRPNARVATGRGFGSGTYSREIDPVARSAWVPQAVEVAKISETLLIDQVVQRLTTRCRPAARAGRRRRA